ncbi:hypothetical protein LshimejAT787_1101900 [Lyophyllum shimeji]|uniref:Uncharacterized protein n=1 Tax=Lyophyllum shimeji TaxID=47721 RepID=A0A9P3US89_LYOSH|nr:hypothetical protein LshimejAT787_1101900 [Lyophyllum shimeji]
MLPAFPSLAIACDRSVSPPEAHTFSTTRSHCSRITFHFGAIHFIAAIPGFYVQCCSSNTALVLWVV